MAGSGDDASDHSGARSDVQKSFFMSPPDTLRELADEVRGLLETALSTRPGEGDYDQDMRQASLAVAQITQRLRKHEAPSRATAFGAEPNPDGRPYYVLGPDVGAHNPVFPLIDRALQDGVTRGSVRFGVAHEGPPGCVHGGIVSLLFDQLLGQHILDQGIPGMTGSLEVRYLRPTPLYTDLTFHVETGATENRKIQVTGRILASDTPTAEAAGLFILPRRGFSAPED